MAQTKKKRKYHSPYREKKAREARDKPKKQLTQAHFKMVEFYLQGHTKTNSMKKAGFSDLYSEREQYKVFGRPDVQREIEKRRYAMKTRNNKIVDRIQDELAKIAFFNMGEIIEITDDGEFIFDFSEATMDEFAAIGECTVETYKEGRGADAVDVKRVKVKPYDKKAALDSLARIHGMFNDKLALEGGESLEQRLAAGRKRMNQPQLPSPEVVEGEFERVED